SGIGASPSAAANLVLGGGTLRYTGAAASTNRAFTLASSTTSTFDITANSLTFSGASASSTGALSKIGAGTLTLSAANAYTGLTTITNGTLAYGVNNALSSGAVTISGASAVLDIGGFTDTVGTVTLAGGGAITGAGILTSTATFALQSGTVSARLGGTVGAAKTTAGTVTLSGANTYTGTTTVSEGRLAYGASNTLATGAVTVNGPAAVLDLGSFTDSVGTVTLSGGGSIAGSGVLTSTGSFALQSGTVSAVLAGTVALNKTTAGTVTLSAANTFTGLTTVSAGALAYGVNNAIGTGGVTVTGATAVLDLGAFSDTVGAVTLAAGGAITGTGTLTGTAAFALQSGTISANLAGAVALNKTTSGVVTLSGSNSFSGTTTVSAGTLAYGANDALGSGGLTVTGATSVLGLGAYSDTVGTLTLSSGAAITGSGTLTSTGSFALQSGAIAANLAGAAGVTKTTTGTVTLTGTNSYTGATTVSAGTLQVGNGVATGTLGSGAVSNAATLIVNRSDSISLGAVVANAGGITGTGALTVQAGGSLAIDRPITLTGTGNVLLQSGSGGITLSSAVSKAAGNVTLVTTGAFTNNAGAGALAAGGRWLVYSAGPGNDKIGGLAHTFKQYNATYGGTVLGSGNGFIYAQAPALAVSLTGAVSKTYDRNSSATLTSANYAFTGAIGQTLDAGSSNDTLVASGAAPTSASFDTAQAGAGKTVAVSGLSSAASGSPGSVMTATNGAVTVYGYRLSTTSASGAIGAIAQASLTAALTGAVSKTYDTTTAATLLPSNYALSGVIGGDTVSVTNPSGGNFNTASVGAGKTVTVTGLSLSGASAANYTLTSTTASGAIGTITPASLAAALTGTVTKTYDATAAAALTAGNYSLTGIFAGDTVTLNNPSSGAYGSVGAGSGKTVTVTGLSISGASAPNYSLASTSVSGAVGTITPASVTAVLTGTVTKTYDATTAAALTAGNYSLSGVIGGDTVTLNNPATGNFGTAGAGAGKTVVATGLALSGSEAANYALTSTSASGAIGAINPLTVTLSGSRAYDGTTAADAAVLSVSNNLDGANLTLSGSGALAGKNVGSQAIGALGSLSLGGSAAGNYSLVGASGSVAVTKAALTFSGISVNAKVYDRTATASINVGTLSLSGVIGADAVAVDASGAAAAFADKNVGAAKTVTISGLNLTGADAANYELGTSSTIATADITAKSLTVAGITANDKVYDGTAAASLNTFSATLSGVISGDTVSVSSSGHTAAFADKNVGAGKSVTVSGVSLSGGDAGNYVLATQPSGLTAAISSRNVTASISVAGKTYDGSVSATIDGYGLDGALTSDSVALNVDGASFSDKNAGSGKAVTATGLTLSGSDAGNYTLTSSTAATTATITPRSASVLGITANGKIYDGTAAATVDTASAALSNIVAGDSVVLNGAAYTAAFTDKNAGTGKTVRVSGFSLSGSDAGNYQLTATSATATADIVRKTISISGIAVNDKVYDATREATIDTAGVSLSGVIAGDTVTVDPRNSTAAFADANAGAGKSVAISGLILAGADASNYQVANASGVSTATITRAPLSIVAENRDRIYGDPNPTFAASMVGLKGSDTPLVVGGLVLSTTATQTSGAGAYAITGGGAAAANYIIGYVPGTLTIARAPLLIAANDQTMVAGSVMPALTARYSGFRLTDTAASVTGLRLTANMTASSPAGTYGITPSDAAAENYEISYANGVMRVTPARSIAILANVVRPPAMPAASSGLAVSPTGASSTSNLGGGASTPGSTAAAAGIPAMQPSGFTSSAAGPGGELGAAAFANGFLNGLIPLPDPPTPLTAED
ncbi:MAG: autotransporter-associated beta strand repeat-containing protein, partial [Rhodospirillaceae bacterium]|nr:autotransporter-associated beta strand repeat-containing protein [Rhodospirillaceae bacterium]